MAEAPYREFLDENLLGTQIDRMKVLDFFPQNKGEIAELIIALGASSYDKDHAGRIVDEILETCTKAPTPADIRRVGYNTKPEWAGKIGCGGCDGTGMRIRVRPDGLSSAEKCDCRS